MLKKETQNLGSLSLT